MKASTWCWPIARLLADPSLVLRLPLSAPFTSFSLILGSLLPAVLLTLLVLPIQLCTPLLLVQLSLFQFLLRRHSPLLRLLCETLPNLLFPIFLLLTPTLGFLHVSFSFSQLLSSDFFQSLLLLLASHPDNLLLRPYSALLVVSSSTSGFKFRCYSCFLFSFSLTGRFLGAFSMQSR